MPQRVRLVLIGVVAVAFAGFVGAYLGAGNRKLEPRGFQGAKSPPGATVPAFSLRDQDGDAVAPGKGVTVYAFLYSHCRDTCPIEVQQIRGALDDLGRDVPVVGISVDPKHDTRASAKAFLIKQTMYGRMDFALGSPAELAPVWKAFGVAPQTDGRDHSARVVVADGTRQRIAFPTSELTADDLAADLRKLGAG